MLGQDRTRRGEARLGSARRGWVWPGQAGQGLQHRITIKEAG